MKYLTIDNDILGENAVERILQDVFKGKFKMKSRTNQIQIYFPEESPTEIELRDLRKRTGMKLKGESQTRKIIGY